MSLDLILVLSGEDTTQRHRSKRAIEMYTQQRANTPILVSGSHSGFLGREVPQTMQGECHQTANYLVSQGIPVEHIKCRNSDSHTHHKQGNAPSL